MASNADAVIPVTSTPRDPSLGIRMWQRKRGGLTGALFALPAAAFFSVFIAYPLARSVQRAFYEDNLLTVAPHYIGLHNFRAFFANRMLVQSLWTTLIFVALATALGFLFGLVWALVLNQSFKGRGVLRALTLLPWVLPSTVSAFLWAWILNAQYGVLNAALLKLHVLHQPFAWLANGNGAMGGIVAARAWISLPWFMLMFLAGLQSVPQELAEAVRVDGGGNVRVLRDAVLPHLNYTMLVALMLGAIGNLQLFDLIYAMTGGGPVTSTTVMSLEVYQSAFQNFDYGMAAAIGTVWLLVTALPAIVYLRIVLPSRKRSVG